MRITIFSMLDGVPWGGSEVLWYKVALAAVAAGHEVQICVRHFDPTPAPIMELEGKGVSIVRRKASRLRRLIGLPVKKFLNRAVDGNRPFMGDIVAFKPNAILVSNAATLECFYYTPLYKLLASCDCPFYLVSQWNVESGPPIPTDIAGRVKDLSRKWSRFYFVARRNLKVFERRMEMSLPRTRVINNPVGIVRKEIAPWPARPELALACVARYDIAYKGQDILIDTLADPDFDGFEFKIDLIGSGPDAGHLQRLIDQKGVGHRIALKGYTRDIDSLWDSYHALVLSSRTEGGPLALIEAMIKGRAAVATDVGDCAELIAEGKTGFLAAVPEREALKTALLKLLRVTRGELKSMGEAAHQLAMTKLDLNPELGILSDMEELHENRRSESSTAIIK